MSRTIWEIAQKWHFSVLPRHFYKQFCSLTTVCLVLAQWAVVFSVTKETAEKTEAVGAVAVLRNGVTIYGHTNQTQQRKTVRRSTHSVLTLSQVDKLWRCHICTTTWTLTTILHLVLTTRTVPVAVTNLISLHLHTVLIVTDKETCEETKSSMLS